MNNFEYNMLEIINRLGPINNNDLTKELSRVERKRIIIGEVLATADRLEQLGYIESWEEAVKEDRSRRYFKMKEGGKKVEVRRINGKLVLV